MIVEHNNIYGIGVILIFLNHYYAKIIIIIINVYVFCKMGRILIIIINSNNTVQLINIDSQKIMYPFHSYTLYIYNK